MIAFHKRKFPTTLLHEGGAEIFVGRGGGVASTWKKLRKQKSHEETSPPPKEKKVFFRGGLRAYSAPQAGAPVFNTIKNILGSMLQYP